MHSRRKLPVSKPKQTNDIDFQNRVFRSGIGDSRSTIASHRVGRQSNLFRIISVIVVSHQASVYGSLIASTSGKGKKKFCDENVVSDGF